jgi:hypothetical protein
VDERAKPIQHVAEQPNISSYSSGNQRSNETTCENQCVMKPGFVTTEFEAFSVGVPNNLLHRVNAKAIPVQAWTGPDGSSRLRLPDWW